MRAYVDAARSTLRWKQKCVNKERARVADDEAAYRRAEFALTMTLMPAYCSAARSLLPRTSPGTTEE
jgi:hypothetical protein